VANLARIIAVDHISAVQVWHKWSTGHRHETINIGVIKSHKAEDRFGGLAEAPFCTRFGALAEAPFCTPLYRVGFLVYKQICQWCCVLFTYTDDSASYGYSREPLLRDEILVFVLMAAMFIGILVIVNFTRNIGRRRLYMTFDEMPLLWCSLAVIHCSNKWQNFMH